MSVVERQKERAAEPPRPRDPVTLSDLLVMLDNLDAEEIARQMRRRPGAIHSMQHRALASLYRFLLEREQVEVRRA